MWKKQGREEMKTKLKLENAGNEVVVGPKLVCYKAVLVECLGL